MVPGGTRTTWSAPRLPYCSLPRPCSPRPALMMRLELEVEQRRQAGVDDEHDVAAVAAVAAVRSAVRLILLAQEADTAAPAVAGVDMHFRFVDEFHGPARGG